ncbi:MAG: lytic transglycosylase domain-containing protein [Novosphingobium sp.]
MILFTVVAPNPALAKRVAPEESAELARCIRIVARGHGWLEKTLWGLRDQEAGWLGAEVANTNGTHDLGPLQINSWWVPRIARRVGRPEQKVRYWLQHDACFNVEAARWIFLSGLRMTGDYWKAIGIYHSPTTWRQRAYAAKVANHLRARFGPHIFSAGAR